MKQSILPTTPDWILTLVTRVCRFALNRCRWSLSTWGDAWEAVWKRVWQRLWSIDLQTPSSTWHTGFTTTREVWMKSKRWIYLGQGIPCQCNWCCLISLNVLLWFFFSCVTSEIENVGKGWTGKRTAGSPGRTWNVKKNEGGRANDTTETWRTTTG